MHSEPPPTEPAASHPPSPRHGVSAAPRLTAQIPSQGSNYSTVTLSSEHQSGRAKLDKSVNARPHGGPQAMISDLPLDANYGRSGDQQGDQPTGHISQSRQSAGVSEPESPMPIDPEPFDLNMLRNGVQHQVYGYPGGTGKSRTNPQDNLGPSRMLLVLIFPHPTPDAGGHSALNVGDGHHQGGQSRDPFRAFFCSVVFWRLMTCLAGTRLPNSPSQDHLAQHSKSSVFFSCNPLGWKE
jgi:hypothetical protein